MKKGRYMLTSKVVVIVDVIVKGERVNDINNRVMMDIGSDNNDNGKENTS